MLNVILFSVQYKTVSPVGDRVFVKVDMSEPVSTGGILLPTSAQKKPTQGEVVSLGDAKSLKVPNLHQPRPFWSRKFLFSCIMHSISGQAIQYLCYHVYSHTLNRYVGAERSLHFLSAGGRQGGVLQVRGYRGGSCRQRLCASEGTTLSSTCTEHFTDLIAAQNIVNSI